MTRDKIRGTRLKPGNQNHDRATGSRHGHLPACKGPIVNKQQIVIDYQRKRKKEINDSGKTWMNLEQYVTVFASLFSVKNSPQNHGCAVVM